MGTATGIFTKHCKFTMRPRFVAWLLTHLLIVSWRTRNGLHEHLRKASLRSPRRGRIPSAILRDAVRDRHRGIIGSIPHKRHRGHPPRAFLTGFIWSLKQRPQPLSVFSDRYPMVSLCPHRMRARRLAHCSLSFAFNSAQLAPRLTLQAFHVPFSP